MPLKEEFASKRCDLRFVVGQGARFVSIDPAGKFAYVLSAGARAIASFSIDGSSGALSPTTVQPTKLGVYAISIAMDPKGKFAFVPNFAGNDLHAFSIDETVGRLTPLRTPTVAAGENPLSVTFSR